VSQRFQRKEILESIVYPSHVVSDQYASHTVVANGRTYVGIAVRDGTEAVVVLTSDGEKVRLASDEIEDIQASSQSAMPEGLLNPLTLEQVADLFAYLASGPTASVAGRNELPSR
jgi:putative heme-binding domain-containing protein